MTPIQAICLLFLRECQGLRVWVEIICVAYRWAVVLLVLYIFNQLIHINALSFL